jgi:hypothetical protein
MHRPKLCVLLWAFTALIFSSLALAEDGPKPTEARLMERAHAYWSALQAGDFATMYGLEAGARDGTLSAEKLRNSVGRSRLLKYAFKEVKIEQDYAGIKVERTFSVANIRGSVPTTQQDRWMFIEGDWYHAQGLRLLRKTGDDAKQDESPAGSSTP